MDLKWVGWIPPVAIPSPDKPILSIFLTLPYQNGKRTPRIQSCFQKLPSHQEVYCNSKFPFPNLMSKLCLSSSYSIDAFGRKSLTNLILYHLIFKYQKNYTEMRKVVAWWSRRVPPQDSSPKTGQFSLRHRFRDLEIWLVDMRPYYYSLISQNIFSKQYWVRMILNIIFLHFFLCACTDQKLEHQGQKIARACSPLFASIP